MAHAANTVTLAQLRKLKDSVNVRLGSSVCDEDTASGLLRAKFGFIPNKVDPEREGTACLHSSGQVNLVMPRTDSGEESFSGTYGARDEADLVLLYDGESMVLERLDAVLRGLHHLSGGVDVGQPAAVPDSDAAPAKRRRKAAAAPTSAKAAATAGPRPDSLRKAAPKAAHASQGQGPRPASPASSSSSSSSSSTSSVSGMPSPQMPLQPAPALPTRSAAPATESAEAEAAPEDAPAPAGSGAQYIPPSDSDSDSGGGGEGEGGPGLWPSDVPPPGASGDVPFF